MSAICARLSKGKVGVQRGRKTAGCPSFLPPRRVPRRPAVRRRRIPTAESQRKTPRPLGRTRLRQFACPGQPVQKKEPPVRANPPAAVRGRCRKRSRPLGRIRLRQFACPGQPVQEKEPPVRANPPAAVRMPRSAGAEKGASVRGEPACGSSCAPVSRCRKRSRPLGANPPAAVRVPWSAGAGKGAAR